jgi:hypothetical protein
MNLMDSEEKSIMNNNPEYASNWKGRILFQVECIETDKPLVKVQEISQEIVD